MKKILLTMACLLTSLAMVQAVTVNWTFDTTVTPSTDINGTSFATDTTLGLGWVVQLVEYSGGYAASGAGNILAAGALGPNAFVPFKSATDFTNVGDASISVYLRIIDGVGNWCNLGVNGGGSYLTTAAGDPSVQEGYVAQAVSGSTTDTSAQGTWIAIPEPGTIILFGLGGLIIAARKKFRK